MKRFIIIGSALILAIIVVIGGTSWRNKVEITTKEAQERISNPQYKNSKINEEDNPETATTNPESETTNPESETTSPESETKESSNSKTSNNKDENAATNSNTNNSNPKDSATLSGTNNQNGGVEEGETSDSNNSKSVSPSTDNSSSNKDNVSAPKETPTKLTVSEIKSQYYPLFNELKAQEMSKIDQLVVQAKADYIKGSSLSKLITTYEAKAKALERSADNSFNIFYQQLQYDLERNGHSLNEAQEFRQTYNAEKQARLSRVLSQLQDF